MSAIYLIRVTLFWLREEIRYLNVFNPWCWFCPFDSSISRRLSEYKWLYCIMLCYLTFQNYKPHLGNPPYLSFWVFTSKCLTQASCPNRSVFGDPSSLNCLGPQSPLCGLVYGIPKSILGQELSHQEWDTMIIHRLRGYSEISGGFKCWFLSVPTWRKWIPNFPSPLTCKNVSFVSFVGFVPNPCKLHLDILDHLAWCPWWCQLRTARQLVKN